MNRPEGTAGTIDVRFSGVPSGLETSAADVPATAWLANFRQPFRLKTAAQKGFNKANSGPRHPSPEQWMPRPGIFPCNLFPGLYFRNALERTELSGS
jgi:hypothetical protein